MKIDSVTFILKGINGFYFTYLMTTLFGIIDLNITLLGPRDFRENW